MTRELLLRLALLLAIVVLVAVACGDEHQAASASGERPILGEDATW